MASEGSQKNLTVVLKCANKILLSNFWEPPSGGNVFLYFFKDKNEDQFQKLVFLRSKTVLPVLDA